MKSKDFSIAFNDFSSPPKALKITPPAKKRRKLPIELKISLRRVGVLNLGNKLDLDSFFKFSFSSIASSLILLFHLVSFLDSV